jgi:DNA (cytosine-5)-methyltransferase 1
MSFPDDLDSPGRTMLTSEGSVNRSTHVIEDAITGNYRILTPIECERLNGFPDKWTDTGMPENFRYFCMGNALVVSLVEKMGHQLDKIFKSENDINNMVSEEAAVEQLTFDI